MAHESQYVKVSCSCNSQLTVHVVYFTNTAGFLPTAPALQCPEPGEEIQTISAASSSLLQVSLTPNTLNNDALLLLTGPGATVSASDTIVVSSSSGEPFRLLSVSLTVAGARSVVFELIDATTGIAQDVAPMPVSRTSMLITVRTQPQV